VLTRNEEGHSVTPDNFNRAGTGFGYVWDDSANEILFPKENDGQLEIKKGEPSWFNQQPRLYHPEEAGSGEVLRRWNPDAGDGPS
jgi:hypothetical protein